MKPFRMAILALLLLRLSPHYGHALLGLVLLGVSNNLDDLALEFPNTLLAVENLARLSAAILISEDGQGARRLLRALALSKRSSHQAAIVEGIFFQKSSRKSSQQDMDQLMMWMLSHLKAQELVTQKRWMTLWQWLQQNSSLAEEKHPQIFWDHIGDCLYFAIESKGTEFAVENPEFYIWLKAYLQAMDEPEHIAYIDHGLTLDSLRKLLHKLQYSLESQREVVPLHEAPGVSVEQLRRLLEQGWTRAACERWIHSINRILAHPKWEYMIFTHIRLDDQIASAISLAEILQLNVFSDHMRLLHRWGSSVFLWTKILRYQDPWMKAMYRRYFEQLREDPDFLQKENSAHIMELMNSP
jgi:hypothetical protein